MNFISVWFHDTKTANAKETLYSFLKVNADQFNMAKTTAKFPIKLSKVQTKFKAFSEDMKGRRNVLKLLFDREWEAMQIYYNHKARKNKKFSKMAKLF